MSNTYRHYPGDTKVGHFFRHPRHKQQLAEYYGAKSQQLPKVRIQSEIIKEGAWADQCLSSADYSERKRKGARKLRRLKKRRKIKKHHPRNTWLFAGDF